MGYPARVRNADAILKSVHDEEEKLLCSMSPHLWRRAIPGTVHQAWGLGGLATVG